MTETLIVMLSVPFALVGGVWLMWWLGFNLSVAVAVGFIALAGVAAETGVVMLIYLDHALTELQARARARKARPFTRDDLRAAIMSGAVERVRPKMMTVVAIMAGLLPIMWSHGTGSEVMQRIAVPMIGGMVSSTVLTLVVIPAIYAVVKGVATCQSHSGRSFQGPRRGRAWVMGFYSKWLLPSLIDLRCATNSFVPSVSASPVQPKDACLTLASGPASISVFISSKRGKSSGWTRRRDYSRVLRATHKA